MGPRRSLAARQPLHTPPSTGFLSRMTKLIRAVTFWLAQRLCQLAINFPGPVLVVFALVTAVVASGLCRVTLQIDGSALRPWYDEALAADSTWRPVFQLGDPVIVLLDTGKADGIFDLRILSVVRELSTAFASILGLPAHAVMSLSTESRPRVRPGTLQFLPLLEPMPDTTEAMQRLREDLEKIQILDGVLVTRDRSATSILVRLPVCSGGAEASRIFSERKGIYRHIQRIVSDMPLHPGIGDVHGYRVSVAGAPVAELELGAHVGRDLRVLVPVAFVIIAFVVWVQFRRAAAVALVLLKAAACLAFTIGLMGWVGAPVELPTAILPVILVATSVSDEVFILATYNATVRNLAVPARCPGGDEAVRMTLGWIVIPATITSAMMAIGFLSFLTSSIAPVSRFGEFTALGILFCWLWSMTVTPAALRLAGLSLFSTATRPHPRSPVEHAVCTERIVTLLKHPRLLIITAALVVGGLACGMGRLTVQDSWVESFPRESSVRLETERIDAALDGVHALLVYLHWAPGSRAWPSVGSRTGPLLDPTVLEAVDRFEAELRKTAGVGGVLGPASHIKVAHFIFTAGQRGTRSIPTTPFSVAEVLDAFDVARGRQRRREVIHDDLHHCVVMILVKGANFLDTRVLMNRVRDLARVYLGPVSAGLEFGGDLAVSQAMIPAIVATQVTSLGLTVAGIALTVGVLTLSIRTAILALVPSCGAIVGILGFMGYWGIPLGVATSMVCAISVGIGADFVIYYLHTTRDEAEIRGEMTDWSNGWTLGIGAPAALRATRGMAWPILTDAAAVSAGFGLLGFSAIPVNARLGTIIAVTLLACAVLTLLVVGSYITLREFRVVPTGALQTQGPRLPGVDPTVMSRRAMWGRPTKKRT